MRRGERAEENPGRRRRTGPWLPSENTRSPKPDPDRPWSELTRAERNAAYSRALHAYAQGTGPNPKTQGAFFRERSGRPGAPAPVPSVQTLHRAATPGED